MTATTDTTETLTWTEDSWYARFSACDLRISREDGRFVLTAKVDGERRRRLGDFPSLESAQASALQWATHEE